jgi:uncharacterized repeat protein (TIGR03803 family)
MTILIVAALFCWSAFESLYAQTNAFNVLYAFTRGSGPPDYIGNFGVAPLGGLTLSGGRFYGTTWLGGSAGNGAVFRLNDDGSGITNLHDFTASTYSESLESDTNSDGAEPERGLVLSGHTIYGTTEEGGSSGDGTLFRMRNDGSEFATLHNFTALSANTYTNDDGAIPDGLILSGNTLYGMTWEGGSGAAGTVFALTLAVPVLGIAPAVNQVAISWPDSVPNFVLQTATDLSSGSWSNISNGINTVGTNYVFTNTVAGQTAFFRLQTQ